MLSVRNPRSFAFCTGVENSYPVITDHKGRNLRRDGMEMSGHYRHWRHDLKLVAEMGLRFLRYGPPYYRCHQGPGKYDWSFPDKTFRLLRELQIDPIADLCHFGLPDWLGASFQNPDWPTFFAEYAGAFARRFPWVRLYTPVNEIMIAAEFSALNGWWNERLKDESAFVTAVKHLCKANILAEQAIRRAVPDAVFVQSESSIYFHPASPDARSMADYLNQRRFLALDLCNGHPVESRIYEYLSDNGVSRQEYQWFMEQGARPRHSRIIGSDYYISNERKVLDAAGRAEGSGEVLGYYQIAKQYYDRYKLPVFHTETNRKDESDASRWLWKEWFNILRLRADGIPVLGFTWYSLLDQTDWDVGLREDNHRINPLGLFDLQRRIRPVGEVYKQIIARWQVVLDAEPRHRSLVSVEGPALRRHSKPSPARGHTRIERSPDSRERKIIRDKT